MPLDQQPAARRQDHYPDGCQDVPMAAGCGSRGHGGQYSRARAGRESWGRGEAVPAKLNNSAVCVRILGHAGVTYRRPSAATRSRIGWTGFRVKVGPLGNSDKSESEAGVGRTGRGRCIGCRSCVTWAPQYTAVSCRDLRSRRHYLPASPESVKASSMLERLLARVAIPLQRLGFARPRPSCRVRVSGVGHPVSPAGKLSVGTTGSPRFLGNPNRALALLFDPGRTDGVRPFDATARPPHRPRRRLPRLDLSGLNGTASALAVYASQCRLPVHHARLASGCWPDFSGRVPPAGFHRKVSRCILHPILLSQVKRMQGRESLPR